MAEKNKWPVSGGSWRITDLCFKPAHHAGKTPKFAPEDLPAWEMNGPFGITSLLKTSRPMFCNRFCSNLTPRSFGWEGASAQRDANLQLPECEWNIDLRGKAKPLQGSIHQPIGFIMPRMRRSKHASSLVQHKNANFGKKNHLNSPFLGFQLLVLLGIHFWGCNNWGRQKLLPRPETVRGSIAVFKMHFFDI